MIRIEKDLDELPDSLFIPSGEENEKIPIVCKKTVQRRKELILNKGYLDTQVYNSRYKMADIKEKLKEIYNGKCAFCEQKVELLHVEHYRPKTIYYWLAYSWDNLLLSCPFCNVYKSTHFDVVEKIISSPSKIDLNNIHTLAARYNQIERPLLLHPELEETTHLLDFKKDGSIKSSNNRMQYTIDTCKLDRKYLRDKRKKVLDKILEITEDIQFYEQNGHESRKMEKLETIINEAFNPNEDFLALRQFAINNWLPDMLSPF